MTGPILVVDDEPLVRKMLARAVERTGAEVVTAADGEEGLTKFQELDSAVVFTEKFIRWRMSLFAGPQSSVRSPVDGGTNGPSVLFLTCPTMYNSWNCVRFRFQRGAFTAADGLDKLTVMLLFSCCCRCLASVMTSMMLLNAAFGRTPLTGAFRFWPRC